MNGSSWLYRPRRTTIIPERTRSNNSNSKNKTLRKHQGGLSVNKENESRGTKRNVLGGHTLNLNNEQKQTKEISSRRSITRRLSFHKTDMECEDEMPFHRAGLQKNASISSVAFNENYQDVDESMLCPLNPSSVMGSTPLPYRIDIPQKGEQKKGCSSIEKQFNLPKFNNLSGGESEKTGLSVQTKMLLKNMGIDTSPDLVNVKHESLERIPEKKSEEISAVCHIDKGTQTATLPHSSDIYGKSTELRDVLLSNDIEKGTQTTPRAQAGGINCNSPGGSDTLFRMMMALKDINIRHLREREELHKKQMKEVEEYMPYFKEAHEGDSNRLTRNLRRGDELWTTVPQSESLITVAGNKNAVPSVGIVVPSVSQDPSESSVGASLQLTAQVNEQRETDLVASNEESPRNLTSSHPPPNCIASAEGASCQTVNMPTDFSINKNETPGLDKPSVWENSCKQNWRRQEVSLLETPQAGRWVVTEDLGGDISLSNTPTLGLNSMLQGMSIQGQQTFMETPATRRLVTKRILKGVESLFY